MHLEIFFNKTLLPIKKGNSCGKNRVSAAKPNELRCNSLLNLECILYKLWLYFSFLFSLFTY
jgi:hypothetical protein